MRLKTISARPLRQPLWMIAAIAVAVLAAWNPGWAGDGGLYGPAAPPGSAFVRVFNASAADDVDARVGNQTLADIRAWNASEFIFLPAGTHPLSAAGTEGTLTLAAARYYTAVVGNGPLRLLDDDNAGNRLKALVILYNLTGKDAISLRTQDGRTAVIGDVANNASGRREVNPAKVQFAVFSGESKIADAPMVSLARGQAFSLFVVGDASAPRLSWAVN